MTVGQCFSNWVPIRGFKGSETRICVMAEDFLLAVINLYVRINIRLATFDTNQSVADSTQRIAAALQKFPDSVFKSVSIASPLTESMC